MRTSAMASTSFGTSSSPSSPLQNFGPFSYVDITGRDVETRVAPRLWNVRPNPSYFECLCCYAQFGEVSDFVLHMRYHAYVNGPNPLSSSYLRFCPICKIRGDDSATFSLHVLSHAIMRRRAHCCPHCHQGYTSRGDFKKHLAIDHVLPPNVCAICHCSFPSFEVLRAHQEARHLYGCEHWTCYLCPGLFFSNRQAANAHPGSHHGIRLSTVPCPISHKTLVCCTYQIMNVGIFRKYFPEFICPICYQILQEECLYIMHILNEHMNLTQPQPQQAQAHAHVGGVVENHHCN